MPLPSSHYRAIHPLERLLTRTHHSLREMEWQSLSPAQKRQIDCLLGKLSEAILRARLLTHKPRQFRSEKGARTPPSQL